MMDDIAHLFASGILSVPGVHTVAVHWVSTAFLSGWVFYTGDISESEFSPGAERNLRTQIHTKEREFWDAYPEITFNIQVIRGVCWQSAALVRQGLAIQGLAQ